VLRAYFHVLRDRLTIDEAAQLAAQLTHLLSILPSAIRTVLQPAERA
jgi:uncharacterized protein (DUF2267 family)